MKTVQSSLPVYEEFNIDDFSPRAVHRFLLKIITDGMGLPLCIPIVLVRGAKPGPTMGISAAVHGNEINGIPVIHNLVANVHPNELSGNLLAAIVVNVPGFLSRERYYGHKVDLNHIMPGLTHGPAPQIYAHRFFSKFVPQVDYLVDLHTASEGRVNSLYVRADLDHPVSEKMAILQAPELIVHNPPSDYTLRGAAMAAGVPAITVEIGSPQIFQNRYIEMSVSGLMAVMNEFAMIPKQETTKPPVSPIMCKQSYWVYTDAGGLLKVKAGLLERMKQGQVLAVLTDIFGEVICEYTSPENGVIIGKAVNPVSETGGRIVHLGILR